MRARRFAWFILRHFVSFRFVSSFHVSCLQSQSHCVRFDLDLIVSFRFVSIRSTVRVYRARLQHLSIDDFGKPIEWNVTHTHRDDAIKVNRVNQHRWEVCLVRALWMTTTRRRQTTWAVVRLKLDETSTRAPLSAQMFSRPLAVQAMPLWDNAAVVRLGGRSIP